MKNDRAVTKIQKKFHDDLCTTVGCIVCNLFHNVFNDFCSIHHIDGRTKKHAHWYVIPLCAGHHQAGSNIDFPNIASVHGNKKRFVAKYDTEFNLWVIQFEFLGNVPKGAMAWHREFI